LSRWAAMVLCRDVGGQTLSSLAEAFHVVDISSINQANIKLKEELEKSQSLAEKLKILYQDLTPFLDPFPANPEFLKLAEQTRTPFAFAQKLGHEEIVALFENHDIQLQGVQTSLGHQHTDQAIQILKQIYQTHGPEQLSDDLNLLREQYKELYPQLCCDLLAQIGVNAVKQGHNQLILELLKGAPGNTVNTLTFPKGNSILHLAAQFGNLELVEALIALGAKLDVLNSSGRALIEKAAWCSHWTCVQALSSEREEKREWDEQGNAIYSHALVIAAGRDAKVELVQHLLDQSACPQWQWRNIGGALFWAIAYNNSKMVRILLENGANPHQVSFFTQCSNPEFLKLAEQTQTPFAFAQKLGHEEIVALFENHGIQLQGVQTTLDHQHIDQAIQLLKQIYQTHGPGQLSDDLNLFRDQYSELYPQLRRNLLDQIGVNAIEQGHNSLILELLKGAPENTVNMLTFSRGQRMIELAVQFNNIELVKGLIEFGVEPEFEEDVGCFGGNINNESIQLVKFYEFIVNMLRFSTEINNNMRALIPEIANHKDTINAFINRYLKDQPVLPILKLFNI